MKHIRQWVLGVVLALLASISSGYGAALTGEVYYFAVGYRIESVPAQNILQLGVVEPCADAWCLRIRRYEGVKNLPRIRTTFQHHMKAPFRSPRCMDEWITTIDGEQQGPIQGSVNPTQEGWEFVGGGFRYVWGNDPKLPGANILKNISDPIFPSATDQVVGFAFHSRSARGKTIVQKDLMYRFDGYIYHKNTLKSVVDNWEGKTSSFDFSKFSASEDGKVLYLTQPGNREVVARKGKELWVQHSVVLQRGADDLLPVLHEYGHDFNMNGCFDEFGHNKLMLPIVNENGGIYAFVYVEYSPDKLDGVPMISVGRYYIKNE